MPSLVERLRRYDDQLGGLPGEAADRIERLEAALREIRRKAQMHFLATGRIEAKEISRTAEEALKEGDGEQQAMRWLLSAEAACLTSGDARRIVRERWGNDVDAALQRKFADPM